LNTRKSLGELPELMDEVESHIPKFNLAVQQHVDTLNSCGETCDELCVYLFEAYQCSTDDEFVAYIVDQKNHWEKNDFEITANALMILADQKFKTIAQKDKSRLPPKEESKMIVLQAQMESAAAGHGGSVHGGHDGRERDLGEWAWKDVAPTEGQSQEKKFRGNDYVYCPNHGPLKWVLKIRHSNCNSSNDVHTDPAFVSVFNGTEPEMEVFLRRVDLRRETNGWNLIFDAPNTEALMHAMDGPNCDDNARPDGENM
jgi:hypothetical protein